MLGSVMMDMNVRVATPKGYEADAGIIARAADIAATTGTTLHFTNDALDAAKGSDVIATDTWVSMGEEDVYDAKMADFAGYVEREGVALLLLLLALLLRPPRLHSKNATPTLLLLLRCYY